MNKQFKYALEQNKDKILLGVSIVGFVGVCLGLFFIINKNKDIKTPDENHYVDTENIKAEYIIAGDKNGTLDLIKVETNKVVNTMNLGPTKDIIYSRSNNLEKVMAYSKGTFYEITEENGDLINKETLKIKENINIKEFKFSNNYIVVNTKNELIVFNTNDKSKYSINIKAIDSFVLIDDTLIYGETGYIYTHNLKTKENKKIELSEKTEALFELNGKLIAFNKFGSGNNKYTILQLKQNDLYIEHAHRHDNEQLTPVTPDSDDKDIVYIDKSIKTYSPSHYKLNLDNMNPMKNRVQLDALAIDNEKEFTTENTITTKGYLYTNKSGEKIEVFRLSGEVADMSIDTNKTFFMPVSMEIKK